MNVRYSTIGVIMGGDSSEREVSLRSGQAVLDSLARQNMQAIALDPMQADFIEQIKKIQYAFIALHGDIGENGTIQGLLSLLRIPFTGSGVLCSALSMHKQLTKQIWAQHGLPVLPDCIVPVQDKAADTLIQSFWSEHGTLILKPVNQGSSVGVCKVALQSQLRPALEEVWKYGDALIEPFVTGDELSVAILNDQVLPVISIKTVKSFYDYQAKYEDKDTSYRCPADLLPETMQRIQCQAKQAFDALNMRSYGRIDFIGCDKNKQYFLMEANTLPGLTPKSLFPRAVDAANIDFDEMILNLIERATYA